MLFPLKIVPFLREIALLYTNFTYKFSSLWSKVKGHKATAVQWFLNPLLSQKPDHWPLLLVTKNTKLILTLYHLSPLARPMTTTLGYSLDLRHSVSARWTSSLIVIFVLTLHFTLCSHSTSHYSLFKHWEHGQNVNCDPKSLLFSCSSNAFCFVPVLKSPVVWFRCKNSSNTGNTICCFLKR